MKLIIEDDAGRKTVVPFVSDEISIGRQEGNTIRLNERNVSRRHALFVRRDGAVLVEDLNSFNGVRVNGGRISGRAPVEQGDRIEIGDYDVALELEPETDGPPALPKMDRSLSPQGSASSQGSAPTAPPAGPLAANGTPGSRFEHTAVIKPQPPSPLIPPSEVRPLAQGEKPRLVLLNTSRAGREFLLEKSEISLGRDGANDVAVDHRSLSKVHAKLFLDDAGQWRVADLASANGVKLNGEPYGDAPIMPGDVLDLGHVKLRFVGPGERFGLGAEVAERDRWRRGIIAATAVLAGLAFAAGATAAWRALKLSSPSAPSPAPVASPAPGKPDSRPAAVPAGSPDVPTAVPQTASPTKGSMPPAPSEQAERPRGEPEAVGPRTQTAPPPTVGMPEAMPERRRRSPAIDRAPQAVNSQQAPKSAPSRGEHRSNASGAYEAAISMMANQDYVGALVKLERALVLDPGFAEAHKTMGICYARLQEPDKGARHYEQYLKLRPDAPDAPEVRRLLADYYRSHGSE